MIVSRAQDDIPVVADTRTRHAFVGKKAYLAAHVPARGQKSSFFVVLCCCGFQTFLTIGPNTFGLAFYTAVLGQMDAPVVSFTSVLRKYTNDAHVM